MTDRIVVHAGFHKTGTTSAQRMLRRNRALLRPHLRVVLRPGMVALCEAARRYSVSRAVHDLMLVRFEAASLAEGLDARPVLLSSEDLCGHMPGRRGLQDYGAAPLLLEAICEVFAEVYPGAALQAVLTTRAPEPWLRSCWLQHLNTTSITMGVDEYSAHYRASADLEGVARRVVAPVTTLALEDIGALRLGPGQALLERAVPALDLAGLTPVPAANTAPPQAKIDAMLAVNRAGLPEPERRAAMTALHERDW